MEVETDEVLVVFWRREEMVLRWICRSLILTVISKLSVDLYRLHRLAISNATNVLVTKKYLLNPLATTVAT